MCQNENNRKENVDENPYHIKTLKKKVGLLSALGVLSRMTQNEVDEFINTDSIAYTHPILYRYVHRFICDFFHAIMSLLFITTNKFFSRFSHPIRVSNKKQNTREKITVASHTYIRPHQLQDIILI